MNDRPRVAIIGCGLIGQKRADALASVAPRTSAAGAAAVGGATLVACADIEIDRARALASRFSAVCSTDWRDVVRRDDVDVVIIATINSLLAEIAVGALEAGKNVLVEKPAARNVSELERVIDAQKRSGKLVHVGFNHRYHSALLKAKRLKQEGALGELMFLRGRYGHGGRLGYEREWRANPQLAGGGELIDQGVHLVDLARLFLGELILIDGFAKTYFWKMPVDDNAFLLLRTAGEQTAMLHVSCTEWKNLFSLEVYGRSGKLHAEGLGGSYGIERLTYYKMLPDMEPPEITIWEYPRADQSWRTEIEEFLEDIRLNRQPAATLEDARSTLQIVEQIYAKSGYDFR